MNIKQVVKEVFSNIKRDWYLPVTEHQVYSEQGTVVGVWTDGKPLYRKAILSTTSKTGWVVAHTEPEAEMLRVVLCDVNVADGTNDWLPATYQSAGSRLCYSIKDNSIKYEMSAVAVGVPVRLIIEYTKTTDTPTTKKVPFEPLVEYSTDEKMIGYWVDGKPIYRKIINLSSPVSIAQNGWSIIARGFDSSYDIIDCKLILSKSYGRMIAIPFESNIEKSSGNLRVWSTTADSDVTSAIIEYTKTTD